MLVDLYILPSKKAKLKKEMKLNHSTKQSYVVDFDTCKHINSLLETNVVSGQGHRQLHNI